VAQPLWHGKYYQSIQFINLFFRIDAIYIEWSNDMHRSTGIIIHTTLKSERSIYQLIDNRTPHSSFHEKNGSISLERKRKKSIGSPRVEKASQMGEEITCT
jgi:hypothetical protein